MLVRTHVIAVRFTNGKTGDGAENRWRKKHETFSRHHIHTPHKGVLFLMRVLVFALIIYYSFVIYKTKLI